jgi:hypothetical protein
VTADRLGPGEVRTGSAYEAERADSRARLAHAAPGHRVSLGGELVLVFESRERVRASLEELLRAERVSDQQHIDAEAAAFADALPGDHELAATLYMDIADPAALADRLAELGELGAAVFVDLGGDRVRGRSDGAEGGGGGWHLLFAFDQEQRRMLLDGGPVAVVVDHPRLRATAVLDVDQVRAVTAALRA